MDEEEDMGEEEEAEEGGDFGSYRGLSELPLAAAFKAGSAEESRSPASRPVQRRLAYEEEEKGGVAGGAGPDHEAPYNFPSAGGFGDEEVVHDDWRGNESMVEEEGGDGKGEGYEDAGENEDKDENEDEEGEDSRLPRGQPIPLAARGGRASQRSDSPSREKRGVLSKARDALFALSSVVSSSLVSSSSFTSPRAAGASRGSSARSPSPLSSRASSSERAESEREEQEEEGADDEVLLLPAASHGAGLGSRKGRRRSHVVSSEDEDGESSSPAARGGGGSQRSPTPSPSHKKRGLVSKARDALSSLSSVVSSSS